MIANIIRGTLAVVIIFFVTMALRDDQPDPTHNELCQYYTTDLSGYEACDEHNLCNLNGGETKKMIYLRKMGIMECRRSTVEKVFMKMNEEAKRNERA